MLFNKEKIHPSYSEFFCKYVYLIFMDGVSSVSTLWTLDLGAFRLVLFCLVNIQEKEEKRGW